MYFVKQFLSFGGLLLSKVANASKLPKNFAEIEGISAERMGGGLPVIYLGEGTSKAGSKSDFEFAKSVYSPISKILE